MAGRVREWIGVEESRIKLNQIRIVFIEHQIDTVLVLRHSHTFSIEFESEARTNADIWHCLRVDSIDISRKQTFNTTTVD